MTKLELQVKQFNQNYKVGDQVEVFKIKNHPETFIDVISNEASIIGNHTPVTWLKNKGCYDLTFVKGIVENKKKCRVQ